MQGALLAALAAPEIDIDPNALAVRIRILFITIVSIVLLLVSISAVLQHGRKGNTRKSWDVLTSSLLALVPGALGLLGIGLVLMASVLDWAIPGLK